MDPNIERSGSFVCKKWTLFSVILISIIWCTVLMALKLVDIDAQNSKSIQYADEVKSLAKDQIMVFWGIIILFNLLGLLGAYKQNFCLTMTYAVFMTLTTFGLFVSVKRGDIHWLYLVFSLLITVLAFAYARDLMIIMNKMLTTLIFTIPSQPQTIAQIVEQQQYSSPSDGWEPPPDYNSEQ